MKCSNCGNENNEDAKFCKNCGNPLDAPVKAPTATSDNHKKIIIGLIIVIIAILAVGALYGMGVFKGEVPLETKDFNAFKLDVPVGSNYVLKDSSSKNKSNLFVGYENKGDYEFDAFGFYVGNNLTKSAASWNGNLYEKDGDIEIYKNDSSGDAIYSLYYDSGDGKILIIGSNTDTMKKMAKSLKDFDESKLASDYNNPSEASGSTSTSSSASSSSTPSSISILGGSFSTGSADEDKTYARINVGTAHAGEDVIVQIFYSRDGNSLNNGNMVPATVHSDGYLEIASADAYKYYPDYATINIYDSNSKLLTTQSVSLSPSAGTQTF